MALNLTLISRAVLGTVIASTSLINSLASAQWVTYVNETSTRLNVASSLVVNDNLEKDFIWGDFDRDGDTDLVCMRKFPGSIQGGFRDILMMNEAGVLVDRTIEYGSAADVAGSTGMMDAANDRDVKAYDVDNDGWLDLITATTMSDQVSTMLGQPRVYRNLGNNAAGAWLGFRFEDGRIPQLFSATGATSNPRFCDAAIGDFTGDGYVDIFFTDYDTPETSGTVCIDLNQDGDTTDAGECQASPGETAGNDFNNKFLINQGAASPGFFTDTMTTRMTTTQLAAAFGNSALAADLNADGRLDIVRVNTLTGGQDVATIYSRPDGLGASFLGPDQAVAGAPYFIDHGDLNGDGRIDLLVVDDGQDKVLINTGNGADGFANFTAYTMTDSLNEFGNTTRLADLDNDGRLDAIITDVDADLPSFCPSTGRRTHIYRNTGVVGGLLLDEQGLLLPLANQSALFDAAVFDIDGNGWLDIVVGRCGGIDVFMNRPPIYLTFSYPSGRPTSVNPTTANSFPVTITISGGGSVVAGTAMFNVSTNAGGAYTAYPLVSTGAGTYTATFPAVACGNALRYYMSATLSNGGPTTDPSTAPTAYFTTPVQTGSTTILAESFEGDVSAWTIANDASVTSGAWIAGVPVGTSTAGLTASPATDATAGSGTRCFMTGQGVAGGIASSQDLDGGPTTLTSPILNLAGAASAQVSMAVWFFCDDISITPADADVMRVEVSNGGAWVLMEEVRGNTAWLVKNYNVGAFVALNSTIQVRLVARDNQNNSITEVGLDEFVVSLAECISAPACPTDLNVDGETNAADLAALLGSWGGAKFDLDGDGTVAASDLAMMLGSWGACP